MGEMQQQLVALKSDKVLSPLLKELALKLGVVSVFRYSAGVVPWSKPEFENISKLWIAACMQAWTLTAKMDGSPMNFGQTEEGRGCPSAWLRDVLDLLDQCINLPGEVSQNVMHHLEQTCADHA